MHIATSIIQENSQLKKDLDFANSEIERLRSKFVGTDDHLFDSHLSSKNIDSLDSCNNNNTSGDFYQLKEAISSTTKGV